MGSGDRSALVRYLGLMVLAACLLLPLPGGASTPEDPVGKLLGVLNLEREKLQPDAMALLSGRTALGRTPLLRAVQSDPLKAPYRVGSLAEQFTAYLESPHRLFLYTAGLSGADISRGYMGNPLREIDMRLLKAEDALAEALVMVNETRPDFVYTEEMPSLDELPNPLRFELARLIGAISSAEKFRQRAFHKLPETLNESTTIEQVLMNRHTDFDGPDYRVYIADVEYEALYAGMLDLLAALEDFDDFLDKAESVPEVSWSAQTALGTIRIETAVADTVYTELAPLLIVDLGGDDVYFDERVPASRRGTSIIYDRAGNDTYFSEAGRGGGGVFGYGVCWDVAGDDKYLSKYLGQSAAVFGAAAHYDEAGSDVYTAEGFSQGYAVAGAAMLIDIGGEDVFESLISSQASAGPFGTAVLVNTGGNDVYTLGNDLVIDPSPQSPEHNVSMGQGAATGLRADLSDGRSLPGGTAVLIDTEGDDVYTAQVFCQGTGYLQGTGILIDGGGNDRYSGVWYAQASGAHRAAGVLLDLGEGDDVYTVERYTSIGTGHDLSTAVFLDEGGNDSYQADSLAFGVGNDNGVGIFIDAAGDDSYSLTAKNGYGLGAAAIENWGTTRESYPGIGLFFDLGGVDEYHVQRDGPADDSVWRWPGRYPQFDLESERGGGLDGEHENPFRTSPRTERGGVGERRLREAWQARRWYRDRIPE